MGTFFIGMAIGPTFGGQLIKLTGNTLSVYYVAAVVHVFYGVVLFLLPESRSPVQMAVARRKHAAERAAATMNQKGLGGRILGTLIKPALPLAVFIPRPIERAGSPGKVGKRDWSLVTVVAAQACTTMILGGIPYKFQYAFSRFGWSSVELGYWLTLIGVSRAVHLALILPRKYRLVYHGRCG
jgi:hypothetical protein